MNRPIKFRAWDKIDNVMHNYVREVLLGQGAVAVPVADEDGGHMEKRMFEDIQLMQFTGLTDKNGKDVYEGDLVEHAYPSGASIYEMSYGDWDNGESYEDLDVGFGWHLKCVSSNFTHRIGGVCGLRGYPDIAETAVIGNVWENPEILNPAEV